MATMNDESQLGGYLGNKNSMVTSEGEEDFFKLLESFNFDKKERTEVVEAGMPPIVSSLENRMKTVRIDHNTHPWADKLFGKERRIKHIQDAITYKPGELRSGGTRLGFTMDSTPIVRWANWGTYRMKPKFFIEEAFQNIDFNDVWKRQDEKVDEIINRKRNNS